MAKNYKYILLLIACFLLFAVLVSAQTGDPEGGGDKNPGGSITIVNPLQCGDVGCLATAVIDGLFKISIPIVAIIIVIGGVQIFSAGGNPEKFKTGKKTVTYAVVGFLIVLLAETIVELVKNFFTG